MVVDISVRPLSRIVLKMMKFARIPFFLLIVALAMYSCTPYKKIQQFQAGEADTTARMSVDSYRPIISPNDILDIYVTSTSPEASKYFNYSENPESSAGMMNGYLVDERGVIQIPFIGSVKAPLTSCEENTSKPPNPLPADLPKEKFCWPLSKVMSTTSVKISSVLS